MILLGAIADDFTGASDLANTLTRQGMRTMLFNGIPQGDADCEAAVIALKTRSVPAEQAVSRSVQAFRWLEGQGVGQILFKYCSTFDSTPEGNIGPVADALMAATGVRTAVVCPAFPGAGRTIYAGHLFVNGVPLHESGMQHHPLNPMTDPDLRRWLELQAETAVDWLPWEVVHQGAAAIRARLEALGRDRPALVVVDALTDDDLMQIGAALDGARLITGGSGIALGLPANFRRAGLIGDSGAAAESVAGPGCVLSGSCSNASRAQVAEHAALHPAREIVVAEVMAGTVSAAELADWAAGQAGASPMLYSTAAPDQVAAVQASHGREAVSERLERLMGDLALALWDRGFRRIAVGGGETSGAVIEALGVSRMRIGAEIAPGVPAVFTDRDGQALGLALKSGNFGGQGFYDRALAALGGA
jgi:uncharacterized protein YgbK (DUF1537 family)